MGRGYMIRRGDGCDFDVIRSIINDSARVYKGILPEDCWTEPYMSRDELRHEIEDGVVFWACEESLRVQGVMGIQKVQDVTLIRHAYVRGDSQNRGVGTKLLFHLRALAHSPVLIGTWTGATWAIRFYEKHGYRLVSPEQKDRLLWKYWRIPKRQIETSVVLADPRWCKAGGGD